MFYHYEEYGYPEDCPQEYTFEAESDEKAMDIINENKYCEDFTLKEVTEPKLIKNSEGFYKTSFDVIRTVCENKVDF